MRRTRRDRIRRGAGWRGPGWRAPAALAGAGLAVLLGAALFLLAVGLPARTPVADPAPHWTLRDGDGRLVTDGDFRGRHVLLYFGYTRCPDICPLTLAAVTGATARLGAGRSRLQPLFITVDPAHDTPARVRAYAALFGGGLIGLTGTAAEIGAAERDYGIDARRTAGGIDHTAVLILLGPDGRVAAAFPASETAAGLARRLSSFLS